MQSSKKVSNKYMQCWNSKRVALCCDTHSAHSTVESHALKMRTKVAMETGY